MLVSERRVLEGFAKYAHDEVYCKVSSLKSACESDQAISKWQVPLDHNLTALYKLFANNFLLQAELLGGMSKNINYPHDGIESQVPTVFDYIVESLEKLLISLDILINIPVKQQKKEPKLKQLQIILATKCGSIFRMLRVNHFDIGSVINSWVDGGKSHFNGINHRFSEVLKQALLAVIEGKEFRV